MTRWEGLSVVETVSMPLVPYTSMCYTVESQPVQAMLDRENKQ